MALYVDSSALVKLVMDESESVPLTRFLASGRPLSSSAIALVEVRRAAARVSPDKSAQAELILPILELIHLTPTIVERAASLRPASLRSLDAIHIASALALSDALEALVTYDRRMAEAATSLGIPVASPA